MLLLLCGIRVFATDEKRTITIEDAIETQRPVEGELKISPDGSRVAYITKTANLGTNRNDYKLYVRNIRFPMGRDNGRVLLTSTELSGLQWINTGMIAVRFVPETSDGPGKKPALGMIDIESGALEIPDLGRPVSSCSIGLDGNAVIFASPLEPDASAEATKKQKELNGAIYGHRIVFREGLGVGNTRNRNYELFLATKTRTNEWKIRKLRFFGPLKLPWRDFLDSVGPLRLSPDGRLALVTFNLEEIPTSWREQPFVQEVQALGGAAGYSVLCLLNITTGQLRLDFNYPGTMLGANWAADSSAYSVIGPSPFGSGGNKTEAHDAVSFGVVHTYMYRFAHVFIVDAVTGQIQTVIERDSHVPGDPKYIHDLPLSWDSKTGTMLVRIDQGHFGFMVFHGGVWSKEKIVAVHNAEDELQTSFDSDGRNLIYVSEGPTRPPDLTLRPLNQDTPTVFSDLNPKFQDIALGEITPFAWVNKYGSHCSGRLIKPTGFQRGQRYPLIIIAAGYSNRFVADNSSGVLGATGFAPQSFASAGFVVLMTHYPVDNRIPKGRFPGQMNEAWNWKAMVESAVAALSRKGLVDTSKVGLAGFSRTSWLCDFTLTHSSLRLKAASSADGGSYTYRGYFKYNDGRDMDGDELMVGGPAVGKTLHNWLASSPAFSAYRVQPALLMEYTGDIQDALELFISLKRIGKAVELYHYPKGTHPLNTPLERLASTQRNLDWFRFWIQGYIGKDPDYDAGQFARWQQMRKNLAVSVKPDGPAH
jgi:hypothetical protein